MLKIKHYTAIVFSLLTLFLFSIPDYASSRVEDIIILNTSEYSTHQETLVFFSHQKHLVIGDTGGYGISCGECHHDEDGIPLKELEMEDEVDKCVECHSNTGKKPKGEKLSKREQIKKYHKKALHANIKKL